MLTTMSPLRGRLSYGALMVGLLLGVGCRTRPLPVVESPKSVPQSNPGPPEYRDEYVDLSAIARTLTLPSIQQEAIWQTWAREPSTDDRQRVALSMLARRASPTDVPMILEAFKRGTPKIRRAALRALLVFGPELGPGTREQLWAAVQRAPGAVTPELVWALVVAQEARVYEVALDAYRSGQLTSVKTFDDTDAYDPALIGLLDLKRTLTLAQDRDPKMRLLAAQACSRAAQTECTPWLLRLVRDPAAEVSAAAAPGLVKIGSDESQAALTQALREANDEHRVRLLTALRDEAGLPGLVAALDSVSPEPELARSTTAQIFELLSAGRDVAYRTTLDPRGADALDDYMQHTPQLYGRSWAAFTLAKLGDLRGLPGLAARLRLTPDQAYPGNSKFEQEARRNDGERVQAANLLCELADAYPEHLGEIRRASEDALLGWLHQPTYWHPSALRALTKMRSIKIMPNLRTWANLNAPLPKLTDDALVMSRHPWVYAAESLHAIGIARDAFSLKLLQATLHRRPKTFSLTMDGLSADPNHPLAKVLQLLESGAVRGLSELGDARAADSLIAFADDPLENESTRIEACRGLAWVASEQQLTKILARLHALRSGEDTLDARFDCFLETFAQRAASNFKPELLTLFEELIQASDVNSAFLVAQALGRIGIGETDENRLLALAARSDRGALPAALALLVGARPEIAQWSALSLLGRAESQVQEVKDAYARSAQYLSEEDLRNGTLLRWVTNAFAVEQAGVAATHWPRAVLRQRIGNLFPQSVPHAMSALRFRTTMYQAALEGNADAIEALVAAGEGGALLAAREAPGPNSYAAYRGYLRLLKEAARLPTSQQN
jgi:hypothetical protein